MYGSQPLHKIQQRRYHYETVTVNSHDASLDVYEDAHNSTNSSQAFEVD